METSNTALKVKTLKERCWGIIQYGLANRSSHAPASYVVQLALTMHSAFEEVEDNWQQMSRRQATDHLLEAQIRPEHTTNSLVAAVTTGTKRAEDCTQGLSVGSAKTPRLSILSDRSPGVEEPSESNLQIRLRWENRTTSPYRTTPPNVIRRAVDRILEKTDNPSLCSIQVAAVRKLKSGDLDLYAYSVEERERLLHNSRDWLAQLEKGYAVRVMGKQYAILAHSIPFEFYPKSRAVAEAKEEVLKSNPGRFPNAEIVHLGWANGFKDKSSKKSSSSLVIAFGDPRHANQAIQEGIFLRGALVRAELYDPGCRVVQCSRCYQFGHVAAMCSSPAACPFCTLAHGRKQCPRRKNPASYKCTNCKGPHASNDRRQCPKWIDQNDILTKVKQRKARLFPVLHPSPLMEITSASVNNSMPQSPPAQHQSVLGGHTASDPGEAWSETGAAPPDQAQANPACPDPRRWPPPPQSSQPTSSVFQQTTSTSNSSSTHLPDTALSVTTQSHTSFARGTQQQISKNRQHQQTKSQAGISDTPSTLGIRKRAYRKKIPPRHQQQQPTASGQGKRRRLENSENSDSTTLDREGGTAGDELESESESESIARIFSRTPSKRAVKTTAAFFEAQSALRKIIPLTLKPSGKGSSARSHSGSKDSLADTA